jgi:lysophospholipase L1-like esterase
MSRSLNQRPTLTQPGNKDSFSRRASAQPQLRAVLFGDSITDRNGPGAVGNSGETTAYNDSRGWFHWANTLLGKPFEMTKNAGRGGDTTTQMLARITDITSVGGQGAWLFGMAGVNDRLSQSPAMTIANLKAIFTAAFNAGYERIVWATVWPDTNEYTTRYVLDQVNEWLFAYAAVTPNFILVNWLEVFVDPNSATSSGSPVPAYTTDGLHPSPLGAMVLGQYLADIIRPYVPRTSSLLMRSPSTVVSANPMMTGSVSGLATGFTKAGFAGGAFKLPRYDGRSGEWQMLVSTATGTNQCYMVTNISGGTFAVGDKLYAELEFETDDDWTACTEFSLQLFASGDATVTTGIYQVMDMMQRSGVTTFGGNPRRGVLRTPALAIPAGVTVGSSGQIRALLNFNGIGTVRIARFAVRKVAAS